MPKKQMKNLTLEELKNICKNHTDDCHGCPMFELDYMCTVLPQDFTDKQLNTEIEVEE